MCAGDLQVDLEHREASQDRLHKGQPAGADRPIGGPMGAVQQLAGRDDGEKRAYPRISASYRAVVSGSGAAPSSAVRAGRKPGAGAQAIAGHRAVHGDRLVLHGGARQTGLNPMVEADCLAEWRSSPFSAGVAR
jgi:hypothetical protein